MDSTGTTAIERLRQDMHRTTTEFGFLAALRHHLPAVLREHRQLPPHERVADLHRWMMADPALRALVEGFDPSVAPPADETMDRAARGERGDEPELPRETVVTPLPDTVPDIRESDGTRMWLRWNEPFTNWGSTVRNTPALTAVPRTVGGLRALVTWAASTDRTVRAGGYRHTWTDLYGQDDGVLVSMLPPPTVTDLPSIDPDLDPHDRLQGVELVGTVEQDGVTKALCRIGAATTNDQFRRWCLATDGGNWDWTVPVNVIVVEITFGGSNATICHGAGARHRTLSDLVASIEFVNARGRLQVVDDPDQLAAAAGCFGLLGIVTSVTLRLDPMTYAVMRPTSARLALTIPPPAGFPVPAQIDMTGIDQPSMDAAWDRFVRACENDYYAEWFWFPYQRDCWINTWRNDGARTDAAPYPDDLEALVEDAGEYLGDLITSTLFRSHLVPGHWQAVLLGMAAMASLPVDRTIVTPIIEALHFRRGVHNMPVLDMELEIPIPSLPGDPTRPDWSVCREAWWAAVAATYADDRAPLRITLEMRVTADSAVTMAPQFGNALGTCSIEVITSPDVDPQVWTQFQQTLVDAWSALRDPAGQPLNVRPHWAKQWQALTFNGLPADHYLRDIAYQQAIPRFRSQIASIAAAGGYRVDDLSIFANPLLHKMFDIG